MTKHLAETKRDRISQLPEAILHQILYFLSQEEAARTSVLSKAWRHVWSTRPNIQFDELEFRGGKRTFMSVLDRTLQRCHDQKLCIQEFWVSMLRADSDSVSLLEKWIPIVLLNMGVKVFSLSFGSQSLAFDVLSVLFQAEFLEYLDQKPHADKLLFKHLRHLYLSYVPIEEETFQKIISSCPLIEKVGVHSCNGLRTVKLINEKLHNLNYFAFTYYIKSYISISAEDDDDSIEINVPTLETISITNRANWVFHDHYKFPNLVSLCLCEVGLSSKLFDDFPSNFPILEKLDISYCYGFNELQLSSHSIKHFILRVGDKLFKAAIDFPDILTFKYSSDFTTSISFTSTSRLRKSNISTFFHVNANDDASSWFRNLNEILKAVSQSEISLHISQLGRVDLPQALLDINGGSSKPLIIVEELRFISNSPSFAAAFFYGFFRICRPSNIVTRYLGNEWQRKHKEFNEYLCKILLACPNDQELRHQYNFWQQDLEEVSMEVYDENAKEWHPICRKSLLECACASLNNEII